MGSSVGSSFCSKSSWRSWWHRFWLQRVRRGFFQEHAHDRHGGWSIYPLGYLFGYLLGAVDEVFLNVLYNIADFVNKIAFVLRAGLAPKQNLKVRRMPCWPREQWRASDSLDEFLYYLYVFSNYLSKRWCFSSPAADVSCSRCGFPSVEF